MATSPKQRDRIASFNTALGTDKLVLARFEVTEAVSELFEMRVEALSEDENIDFDRVIGRNASISVRAKDTVPRLFNGVVVNSEWIGLKQGLYAYRLTLRPWFWLMTRSNNCRIFNTKSVTDVIREVFQEAGFNDFRLALSESYPELEYCVQYRESDYAFVSRLMEEFGIYYFFEHSEDKHMMVLSDAKSSHKPVPGISGLPYLPTDSDVRRVRDHVTSWTAQRSFNTGRVKLKDYDYQKPGAKLEAESDAGSGYQNGKLEVYDYPGRYIEQGLGDRLARIRLEAEQAKDRRRLSAGNAVALYPGALVTLEKHQTQAENIEYLVLRCTHAYAEEAYRSVASEDPPYTGTYEMLPASVPFRAPATTPCPVIGGPQTAKVVGRDGEEIDVDEQGRITVQFHWDKKKVSRRVRIGQTWAGKSFGAIVIPRIGMEAIVQFLEGDPDQPLVVGTVYNGDNKLPYDLPGEKTKSGFKTESSKGGGGYNELVFEDKSGSEEIGMRAEKDLNVVVRNKETREIGDVFLPPKGSPSRETTLKYGDDKLTVSMGDRKVDVSLGSDSVDAMLSIKLTVGPSSITITPVGIVLDAPMITIKGAAMVTTTAPMVTTNADGVYAVSCSGALAINTTVGAITGKSGLLPPLPPTSVITIA
jgi:type VI secretion system secreted protein VgrG